MQQNKLDTGGLSPFSVLVTLALVSFLGGCEKQDKADAQTGEVVGGIDWQGMGSCEYLNVFSSARECRNYRGTGWEISTAENNCAGLEDSQFSTELCDRTEAIGRCLIDEDDALAFDLALTGDAPAGCQMAAEGCVLFARGRFEAIEACEGAFEPVEPVVPESVGTVFVPFEEICLDREGEQSCAWQAIGGCAPEGELFADYASCEPVLTQRPYVPVPASGFETAVDDPIRQDDQFIAEVEWVRSQAKSCGCVCCHEDRYAPSGAAVWDTDREGIWTDDWNPRGLAMGAGWLDSSALGAFDAEDNNGFDRSVTVLPTTDIERMRRFFEGELARRGLTRDDFNDSSPIGGPLYEQVRYVPTECERGEQVGLTGEISWSGGAARYIYVLSSGTTSPGAPPNFDRPEGMIWKLDVDHRADGIMSARYGETLDQTRQSFPESGSPAPLVEGEEYYLYVLKDIGVPITRCVFTYGDTSSIPASPITPPWGQSCTDTSECPSPTDFCVMAPGDAEGYCSTHCDSAQSCINSGAPEAWACVAVSCETEAFTWCGEPSEVEESGGFLKLCP